MLTDKSPITLYSIMGAPGQSSVQITFKVNKQLKEKIDREREINGGTTAEFMNDAVKFYIDHLEERRYQQVMCERMKTKDEDKQRLDLV